MTARERIIKDLALSPKRYEHTLSVAGCAVDLAKRHYPHLSLENIELAALLHDFTKEMPPEKQRALCKKYGIKIPRGQEKIAKLYHAKTAASIAKSVYALDNYYADAIYYHTTGRAGMTEAEEILYFADYIEPTRKEKPCIKLREYYIKLLAEEKNHITALKKGLLFSFDLTIKILLKNKERVCVDTIKARNYIIDYLKPDGERNAPHDKKH